MAICWCCAKIVSFTILDITYGTLTCTQFGRVLIAQITINEERIIVFYGCAICAIRDTLSVTRFRLNQNSERPW